MRYVGSKNRIAKDILPIILKDREPDQWYVEPFVGGCNSIQYVTGNRIGSDINIDLIDLWIALQNGWKPPEHISLLEYESARISEPSILRTWIGFSSFGAKFFGGYPRDGKCDMPNGDYRNVMRQVPKIKGVKFIASSFGKLFSFISNNSIIYCDPPYKGTQKYHKQQIHYEHFYEWCFEMKVRGHKVFISEFEMPKRFKCIWEYTRFASLGLNTGSKDSTERLFKC
jgi:DNA adenine methylase